MPEDYVKAVDGGTITNTHETAKTSYTVTKVWEDDNDQDGLRPESIDVQLFANGEKIGDVIALNEENQWTYTWTELEQYADGAEIVYTVDEVAVPDGYIKSVDGNIITNSRTSEATDYTVTKVWDDAHDQDQIRPDSIQVQLYANGTAYGDPVVLSADTEWTYTWTELPKNAAGEAIVYTVQEVEIPEGYTAKIEGNVITNTHVPEKPDKGTEDPDSSKNQPTPDNSASENENKAYNVDTGDHSNMTLWVALMMASVVMLGALVIVKKKENYND